MLHTRTVPSPPPAAKVWPSGLNAMVVTGTNWPGSDSGSASQVKEVPKLYRAVAATSGKGLPIGTKRECIDRLGLAGEAAWLRGEIAQIPQPPRAIVAARGQRPAIGTEGDRVDRAVVAGEHAGRGARGGRAQVP